MNINIVVNKIYIFTGNKNINIVVNKIYIFRGNKNINIVVNKIYIFTGNKKAIFQRAVDIYDRTPLSIWTKYD